MSQPTTRHIDTVWAAVTVEPTGQEQFVLFNGYAVIAADPDKLPLVQQIASMLAFNKNIDISLVAFTRGEVVEKWEAGHDGKDIGITRAAP